MTSGDTPKRRQRGWLAPRDGGYSFRSRSGRRNGSTPSPPGGSAGVGDPARDTDRKRSD